MSQTRLCRDSTRESERNGSVYTNSKGQISLAKGYMHKDAKSLSLKLATTSLPKKEHWLLNGKGQQNNDLQSMSNENHNFGGSRLDVSNHSYNKSDEKLVSTKKKMSGSTLSEKSVHEKINFSLHLPMESSDLSQSVDNESLRLTDSGFVDDADDKNKMADKKSKGKRKKNVTKKTVCTSLQLNNNNDETGGEDINGNPVNSNQSPVYNHPDVSQIDSLQKEMGKELAYKQALKPTDSQETSGSKIRKNRKEAQYILAEDIPDYRGRDKIEDILKFIGKNPSNETLNKSLERKKKSKRKGLNGHVLRSGIGSMDAKSELSDSESTNLCPTKSASSFLDKEYCNCDASEIDSCQDDDSCLADDSFVSSPGNSAPPSEPFILVEKKNKKKVYLNSSSNNPRANRYLSSKSPFRNRRLNSAMAHAHHPHHQFDCDSKTELDSSFPDLESSYHKMRRNSTGNVAMSMSAVQSVTLEDSDNESWKSLPISQGAHLINEKNYPVSYAKIAASSLPSNSVNVTGNSSIISGNDDGGGTGSCSSGSGGSTSSDGVVDEKNLDGDSTKDSNMSIDSDHCKIACTRSESGKDDKYLLRDNYGNKCMNRRHSIGECVGSQDAAIESVADTKQEISRSQHLLGGEDGACDDINTECQIYFCDRKSVTSGDELVGKLSLKDRSPSSSIETLTPSAADAETKILGECRKTISNMSATPQHNQSCSSSSSVSSHSGAGDDALAVKFVNPRDRRHNDKQFKITFGFFCDTDARNIPQGDAASEEGVTPPDLSLPSSNLPPPLLPSTSPKLLEMFAAPPLQQNFEISNRVRDTLDTTSKESEDSPLVSDTQNTDFVTDGSKKDNNKATTAIATSISSSSSSSSFSSSSSSSSAPRGAICDLVKKDVKPVDVSIKSANKLNGLVLPFGDKTCLTPSSSVAPVSKQAVVTTNTIVSATTTDTTKKSIISPAKTLSSAASPNNIRGARDSNQLVTSNSVTNKSTTTTATTTTTTSGNSSCTNNNNASAAVNAADSNVHEEFGLIPLSYGNKIKADNKKVIHFRSDDADAQLFNQEEVLSYLSKEYHRVCQLSGPSTIVRVGTE